MGLAPIVGWGENILSYEKASTLEG